MKVQTQDGGLNLILAYRSPNSTPTNTENLCKIISNMEQNSILIGDINLPGVDWAGGRADGRGKNLYETAVEVGVEQLVTFPTHIRGNI